MRMKEYLIRMLFNEDVEKYRVDAGRREATIARQDSCIQELNVAVENLGSELTDSHDTNTRLLADAERLESRVKELNAGAIKRERVIAEFTGLLLPRQFRYETVEAPVIALGHGDFDGVVSAAITMRHAILSGKRGRSVFDINRDWHEYLRYLEGREIYVLDMPVDQSNYNALLQMQERNGIVIVIGDKGEPPREPVRHFRFFLMDRGRITTAQMTYDYFRRNGKTDSVSERLSMIGLSGELGGESELSETAWRIKRAVDLKSSDIEFMQTMAHYLAKGTTDMDVESVIDSRSEAYEVLSKICYEELLKDGSIIFQDGKRLITKPGISWFEAAYHPMTTAASKIRSKHRKSVFAILPNGDSSYKLVVRMREDVYDLVALLKEIANCRGGGHGTAASLTFPARYEGKVMRALKMY